MGEGSALPTAAINGYHIGLAPLSTINFAALENNDQVEVSKLLQSCQTQGFFYLDLRGHPEYLAELQILQGLAEKYFNQPYDVKMKDHHATAEYGYEPGNVQILEFGCDKRAHTVHSTPEVLQNYAELIQGFMSSSDQIGVTILSRLSDALRLENASGFKIGHVYDLCSNSSLKFGSLPTAERLEEVLSSEHTDTGTLTLLFCDRYSTEIILPGGSNWAFIKPKYGHAIVNVADSLQASSGGVLRSCLHRINQPSPGAADRLCLAHYLRPGKSTALLQ